MTRYQENAPHSSPRQNNDDYWLDIFGDVDFPANRSGLWEHARSHKADALLLNRLKDMPERTYKNIEDFRKVFGGRLDNYGNVH